MAAIDKAIKINSECFFTYELKDDQGDGTGYYRVMEQDRQSRTILGIQYTSANTKMFSHKEWKKFVKEIKKTKYKFKKSDMDDEMKDKFKEENMAFEDDQGENEQ